MCGRRLAGFFGTSVLPVGDALTDCCSGSRLPGIEHSSGRAWSFPLGDPYLVSASVTACSSPEPRAPGAILHFRRLGAAPLRAVLRIRAVRPNRRKRATSRWPGAGPTRASVRAGRFAPHTTTSPTRLSPPPLCTGRRSGRPCAAAPRPGAISYPHRLGAVLLRAVLRIRAARSDRRRRATFRWPGAGPTRAAVWAGRCAPTTTTLPARLSPPRRAPAAVAAGPALLLSTQGRSRTSTSSAPCRCRPSSAPRLCALTAGGAPPSAGPAPGLRGPPPSRAVRPEYDYFADATVTSAAVRRLTERPARRSSSRPGAILARWPVGSSPSLPLCPGPRTGRTRLGPYTPPAGGRTPAGFYHRRGSQPSRRTPSDRQGGR